jgi:hypothetical protein
MQSKRYGTLRCEEKIGIKREIRVREREVDEVNSKESEKLKLSI